MKRTGIVILLAVMVLAGCANNNPANNSNVGTEENTIASEDSLEQNNEIVKEDQEAMELKACFGTITKISDGKVYIEGVNDVLYVGGTELLGNLKVDDFVYFEYSTGEKRDNEYEVELTILRYEDRDPSSKKLVN